MGTTQHCRAAISVSAGRRFTGGSDGTIPGISRAWKRGGHKPRRLRQPTWSPELALAVLHLREQYPRWGKDKLVVLLRERGWQVSTSMVGRILRYLKTRGVLKEAPRNGVSTRKRLWRRPYAIRKPREYPVREPGDLVQVDTLDVRPIPGMVLKHFTARDMVSRWDVVEVRTRATANHCHGLSEHPPGPDAFPGPSNPGRRRLRVPGRVRAGLSGAIHPPLRTSPSLSQAQWLRGAGPTHPHRGVL